MFGNIYGIVTDAKSGEPIQAVSVTLNPGGIKTTVGSDGRYEYNHIDPGQYTVQAIKGGYQTVSFSVTVQSGDSKAVDIPMAMGVSVLSIDKSALDMGANDNIATFNISNTGSSDLSWQITYDCEWIESITPQQGTAKVRESASVSVKIDRSKLTESKVYSYSFIITSSGGSKDVTVRATGNMTQGNLQVDKTGIDSETTTSGGGNTEIPHTAKKESSGVNAEVAVNNGLICYYTFEDGKGTNKADDYYHGNLINSPDIITDTPNGEGKAIFFRASEKQYMNIAGNPFENQPRYSISFWIKDFRDGFIFSGIGSKNFRAICFPQLFCTGGKFVFSSRYWMDDKPVVFSYGANAIQDGQWHFVSITCMNNGNKWTINLYVDGILVDATIDNTHPWGEITKIQFGGNGDGMYTVFAGQERFVAATNLKLGNIRIYNRELNAKEVKAIYNLEK
jgi:hypothetical protein